MKNPGKVAIANRRQKVAEMYLRGATQAAIGRIVGVTQTCIAKDLKAIRQEWQQSALLDFSARKAQELAKIDEVERAAWDGWRRSQENAEITRAETDGEKQRAVKVVEGQAGDSRFLAIILDCVARRCKILGVDAPLKMDMQTTAKYEYQILIDRAFADPAAREAAAVLSDRLCGLTPFDQPGNAGSLGQQSPMDDGPASEPTQSETDRLEPG